MQSRRKSGLGLPGDDSSVLGHAGSAGPKGSSQKHAKMWTQGLQKHWSRRDVHQPSNPEALLARLCPCCSPRQHQLRSCQEGSQTQLQLPATSSIRPAIQEGLLGC